MSYVNQHNFDWSITNRDIVLYIPNFKRKHLLLPTLCQMQTSLPKDKWIILVVNDGPHEDMSDLALKFNITYFTFEREPAKERNGCLIRNYIIKRVQSRVLATRDPEIFITGDNYLIKLSEMEDIIYRPHEMVELQEPETPKIIASPNINLLCLKTRAVHKLTNPMEPRAFHAGVAVYTKRLIDIGGYDEDFVNFYGWEDIDILHRLVQSNAEIFVDNNVNTYHVWHPRKMKFLKTVRDNQLIYQNKRDRNIIIANQGKAWGNG